MLVQKIVRSRLSIALAALALVLALVYSWCTNALAREALALHAPALALVLDRSDSTLAFNIGTYYFGGNLNNLSGVYELDRAVAAYQKALVLNPRQPLANFQLSRIYLVQGKFTDALAAADREIALNPQNKRTYYNRGLVYAYAGDLPDAVPDFQTFIAWSPQTWAGYNDLAWVLSQEGKYTQAKSVLMQGFKNAPYASTTNPWLWDNLGVQQLNLHEYKDALYSFTQAQILAGHLTPATWHNSYPGNNAAQSADGINQFRTAIAQNIQRAQQAIASSTVDTAAAAR